MFETPDRHTPSRMPIRQANCTFRTSHSPEDLSPQERYTRQRNRSRDPFRSCSDSSPKSKVKHQVTANGNGTLAPHFTPSFIDVQNTSIPERSRRAPQNVRYISQGSIWAVGGREAAVPRPLEGIDTGMGDIIASGTNAPMVNAHFVETDTEDQRTKSHEARLALALDIDQARRVLPMSPPLSPTSLSLSNERDGFNWQNGTWARDRSSSGKLSFLRSVKPTDCPAAKLSARRQKQNRSGKSVPSVAFRVLDAPRLKDDFYCSVLAYYYPSRTLAVALTHRVYLWTESHGVRYPPLPPSRLANYVSSLAFSSSSGRKGILAIARNSGHITLWSLFEQKARFEAPHPWAICSVAFRPTTTSRQAIGAKGLVMCEDLLVGDDAGCLYYYSIHWPEFAAGSMTLLTKLDAHSQNICGLAWSPDGRTFVSGGNDNTALLFDVNNILDGCQPSEDTSDDEEGWTRTAPAQRTASGMLTPPTSPLREPGSRGPSYGIIQHSEFEQSGAENPTAIALQMTTPLPEDEFEERQGRSRVRSP